jgi:O-antigen ligase
MLGSIKELIVVLAIAATIFRLARPIALQFMSSEDFSRRRCVWFVLTVVSFLSPNFWLYLLVAVPVLVWADRRDSNPIALYLLLLHVIPEVDVNIPLLGNNGLFALDNYRLLAFCILVPAVLRHRRTPAGALPGPSRAMDVLLLVSGVLEVVLYIPPDLPHHFVMPDSASNGLRRAVLFFLDTYLLYFAVSRICRSRQKLVDAAAAFCLACAVMAPIAMFEQLQGWLLYVDIGRRWGTDPNAAIYLMRGNFLRAQASAGHALAMGYLLAVASGFWLYLKSHVASRIYRIGVTLLLWGGLFATYSRGPWLGTVVIYFAFNAAGARAFSRVVKGISIALLVAGVIAVLPIGGRILDVLPVFGKTADNNILYRERLADRGWELVSQHPLFGDQFPWPDMEIVNTYMGVALNYGLIGLFCFVGFILIGFTKAYRHSKAVANADPDLALLGAGLVACIAGTLVMLQSASFRLGYEKMFYVLAGLAIAYATPSMAAVPRLGLRAERR